MDRRVVLLAPEDNGVVVTQALAAGDRLEIEGHAVVVAADLGIGHKLARVPLGRGEKVIKYGATIGRATAAIDRGAHVHTHNLESEYIRTHPGSARQAVAGGTA